jgi:hypothetical protein
VLSALTVRRPQSTAGTWSQFDYSASLDRLFWTSSSLDSQLLVDDLPIDSSLSIDLEASIDRFPSWDRGIELRTLDFARPSNL